jgi:hypothetical protein
MSNVIFTQKILYSPRIQLLVVVRWLFIANQILGESWSTLSPCLLAASNTQHLLCITSIFPLPPFPLGLINYKDTKTKFRQFID